MVTQFSRCAIECAQNNRPFPLDEITQIAIDKNRTGDVFFYQLEGPIWFSLKILTPGREYLFDEHGSVNLERFTSSGRIITEAMMGLFDRCVDPNLLVRRITVVANHIISENDIPADADADQPDLFTDYEALEKQKAEEQAELDKEKRLQQAIIGIKNRMGKNAILKGTNFVEGATGKERNEQIGGHRK